MLQSHMSTVSTAYDLCVQRGDVKYDEAQKLVVTALDQILSYIDTKRVALKSSALGWLFAQRHRKDIPVKGLYIYGSPGCGKTMLMDMFYELIPEKRKRRIHFNDFMVDVHERIHEHRQKFKTGKTDEKDPILPVATALYEESWILCFDEFSVTDITDAMILSRLFQQLLTKGCLLVITSNIELDNLYKDGLSRELFIPFLDLLKTYVDVLNLNSSTDYRMERTSQIPVYVFPLGKKADQLMDEAWEGLTSGKIISTDKIENKGRYILIPKSASGCARFSFNDLCAKPLGASDYIEIVKYYHTIVLDHVPQLGDHKRNESKRFITLIDVLYDKKIRLFMSADVSIDCLYNCTQTVRAFEFTRTISRLHEMQSLDYLESIHQVTGI